VKKIYSFTNFSTIVLSLLTREDERVVNLFTIRPKSFLRSGWNVPDRLHERFRPSVTFLRSEKLRNGHQTYGNDQERTDYSLEYSEKPIIGIT
jgi:hypothetical protein